MSWSLRECTFPKKLTMPQLTMCWQGLPGEKLGTILFYCCLFVPILISLRIRAEMHIGNLRVSNENFV